MQTKLDKTSEQIYQNIQTLELYKRFPLEIYEWLHVSDRYLTEISSLISKFFGYINYWMDVNANRFSQYVDAIITIIAVVKTYQVMVDLFVDRGKKCGKCTQDSYDQYSCKLSMLCPNLPIIPIPNVKIPSLYVDLSHLALLLAQHHDNDCQVILTDRSDKVLVNTIAPDRFFLPITELDIKHLSDYTYKKELRFEESIADVPYYAKTFPISLPLL